MARTYQIITLFARDTILRNVTLALLGLSPLRWNPLIDLDAQHHLVDSARAALARVGLDHIAERPLAQTSYGERRRVEIAMALAQNPKVLLLDEPFAGLSIDERRDVQELLRAHPARRDHRDDRAQHGRGARIRRADHAAAFRRGDRRRHARRRGRRSAHAGGLSWPLARSRLSDIDAFYGDSHVLQQVSFALGEGRLLGLLGRNGAGKSTCMNVTVGLLPPRTGKVEVFGTPVTGLPPEQIAARGVALVPQGRRIFKSLTVRENLIVAARRPDNGGATAVDRRHGVRHVPAAARAPQPAGGAISRAASSRCSRSAAP